MGRLIFDQDELPPLNSPFMKRLAKHFWEMKNYFHDARRLLELKWRECDEAYLCYRYLPDNGAIDWLDDGEFGETDVHDNVNLLAIRMVLALMPKGSPYLNVSGDEKEPQEIIDAIRDFLVYTHRQSRTRRQIARFVKQLLVRGDSALIWSHQERYRYRRLGNAESAARIGDYLESAGMSREDARKFGRARVKETLFSGPTIRVLDTHDYFLSPITDLTNMRNEPMIVQTFRYMQELMAEVDDDGKPTYGNLKGMDGSPAYELYSKANDGAARIRSLQIMGINPETSTGHTKLVPVYVCYVPYLEFEGKKFYDTYFHVALDSGSLSTANTGPRMIRVEESPSDHGHQFILPDTYIDFFTNVPHGISAVEKAMTALRQKNVAQALTFNAMVATQFPAQLVLADAFKDGEVSFAPGYINELSSAQGLDVMAPVPTPDRGLVLGLQDLKFMGDEIRAKMGIDGLTVEGGSRSVSKSKTATEVNRDMSTGSLMLDEQTEKFSDTLTDFFQGSFNMMQQRIEPNQEGYLDYQKANGERIVQAKVAHEEFMKDRTITVSGIQGIFSREQRLQMVVQSIDMVSRAAQFMPNAPSLLNDLVFEALRLMNVPVSKESKMSPQELAAANPQVQLGALQQAIKQIGQASGGQSEDITDAEIINSPAA